MTTALAPSVGPGVAEVYQKNTKSRCSLLVTVQNTAEKTSHRDHNANNVIVAGQQSVYQRFKNKATSWNISSGSLFTCGMESNNFTLINMSLTANSTAHADNWLSRV